MGVSKRRVRWWITGREYGHGFIGETLVVDPDGRVKVEQRLTGQVRAIRACDVQVLERGPRGGKRWVPLSDLAVESVRSDEWAPMWSQMDLFGGEAA